MKWDEPSPTITSGFRSNGQGRFTHPSARPGRPLTFMRVVNPNIPRLVFIQWISTYYDGEDHRKCSTSASSDACRKRSNQLNHRVDQKSSGNCLNGVPLNAKSTEGFQLQVDFLQHISVQYL